MRNDFCSGYLAHSAKGTEWSNHRYIKKIIMPDGEPYYFYTMDQYQAYLKTLSGERQRSKTGFGGAGEYAKKEPHKDVRDRIPLDRITAANNRTMNNNLSTAEAIRLRLASMLRPSYVNSNPTAKVFGKVLEMTMSDAEKRFLDDVDKIDNYLKNLKRKRHWQAEIRSLKKSATSLMKDPVGTLKNDTYPGQVITKISNAAKSKKKKGK